MDQQILVPFDGSEEAETALIRALEENPTAEITVLHILESSESAYSGIQSSAAESSIDPGQSEAEKLFEQAQKQADEYGKTLETAVEVGEPGEEIVIYAEENGIDHIIMGSHGRSGISRIIVGSVAETVIRNSPLTVTIAR